MIVKVALAVPPNYMFDYQVATDDVKLFDRVLVPVSNRKLIGFIVEKNVSIDYQVAKVKPVIKVLDNPISTEVQCLIIWISDYYCCDMYNAIRLSLPNDYFKHEIVKPHQDIFVRIDKTKLSDYKPTKKQILLLDKVGTRSLLLEDLKNIGTDFVIKKLFENEIFTKTTHLSDVKSTKRTSDQIKQLNPEQEIALQEIFKQTGFFVSLLYGVTGSGKTEVYLQAIDKCMEKSQQVLVLIPEINLTPQTAIRFERRFYDKKIAILHSKLSEKDRLTNWCNIKSGSADIVISTRSGVLADFKNLGMIVVDEEHDGSFKQQTSVIRYNARDIAVFRARALGIPVILGSATPSIESYYNAITGKYQLLKLTSKALNSFRNEIRVLDLKATIVKSGVSSQLLKMLENNIIDHNQSLVFVNKLGFARALICKSCAAAVECKKCDKPYTLHSQPYQYLECHHCGTRKQIITSCPICEHGELFTYGVGTERLQAQLETKFPYNNILRFDRSSIKSMQDLDKANLMINSNQVDIIVGTQMIAKGHHFEKITLVGLINVDAGLYSSDFHAMEKTAQLIIQVSGRAGRADKPGVILLQTYQPDNRLLQLLVTSDYLAFLDYLLEQRKFAEYPPYTYQAQIIAESKKESAVLEFMNKLNEKISACKSVLISGPMPAIHLKKNNTYKYQLLITSGSRSQINLLIKWVRLKVPQQNDVKISFDIDPISLA